MADKSPPEDLIKIMEAVTPKTSLRCTILSPWQNIIKIASTPPKTSSSQSIPSCYHPSEVHVRNHAVCALQNHYKRIAKRQNICIQFGGLGRE